MKYRPVLPLQAVCLRCNDSLTGWGTSRAIAQIKRSTKIDVSVEARLDKRKKKTLQRSWYFRSKQTNTEWSKTVWQQVTNEIISN